MFARHPRPRHLFGATAFLGIVAAVALAIVPTAFESSTENGLQASVTTTNRGPLTTCSAACAGADTTWNFVYVSNKNRLTNANGGTDRNTVANTFVVTSVDQTVFVDGVQTSSATFTPPPDAFFAGYSGHWPATVTCSPRGGPPPCGVVGAPAILPGEQTAAVYVGWAHASGEANGKYVFRYTVHGTLNGEPTDVSASSPPIKMTD